jgi:hypothetical protein
MSKVSEEGFLFIHSSVFDADQIEKNLNFCIRKLREINNNIKKCDIYVNVVENKEGQRYGHTYSWVSNVEVFNALIGMNFDGSERMETIEDENWTPPSIPLSEAIKDANGDWAKEAEIEERYECPSKEIQMDPLIVPPGIKYTEEQKQILGIEQDFGFIEIFPARVTIRTNENKSNSIYSSCISEWVNEDILFTFFKRFTKDKMVHKDSKTNKTFSYPKITITKNTVKNKWRTDDSSFNAHVHFSPLDKNIGHFIMNIARKIKLKNPNTNKYEMIFFSQSRGSRT